MIKELSLRIGNQRGMPTSQRPCYIHIGTHKTGTTSIQVFLGANRERFADAGVIFPVAGTDCYPDVAHHHVARELNASSAFDPRFGGLQAFAEELRRSDAQVACLSSEDLSFLWDKPGALEHLRNVILSAGFSPKIVIYLRPQVAYCCAVYAECVRQGYTTSFAAYFSDVMRLGNYRWGSGSGPPFDYNRLLEPFARTFGRRSMIVRRYRTDLPDNSLLFDFARILLPRTVDVTDFTVPGRRENGSLDFGAVLERLDPASRIDERIRFSPLSVVQTLRLGRRFAWANAKLATAYGVPLPPFELLDFALAIPLRRTRAKTRALSLARRMLAKAR